MARVLYDSGSPFQVSSQTEGYLALAAKAIGTIAALRKLHRPVAVPTVHGEVAYFCAYDFHLWPCPSDKIIAAGMGDAPGTSEQRLADQ